METKGTLALKENNFEYIQVTGRIEQFGELKKFCNEDIKISYETASCIGDYWLIQVDDCLKGKWVGVPTDDFILKLPCGYTVVSSLDVKEFFDDTTEYEDDYYG